jgi:hypothetical protein
MKKIIAAAVAATFVAPAFAADVSVSGSMAFVFSSTENAGSAVFNDDDNAVTVSGSEELAEGMTITGNFVIADGSGSTQTDGSNIALGGAFGNVVLGDAAGAADSMGDYSDLMATGMGFGGDGDDAAILYTLPIEGLEVNLSYSPDTTANIGTGTSVQGDVSGISVEGNFGPVTVGVAQEESSEGTEEQTFTAWGLRYSANGLTVGYDAASEEADVLDSGSASIFSGRTDVTAGAGDIEYTGLGVSYTMGNITLAAENQQVSQDATDLADSTGVSFAYATGGATFFVANSDNDVTDTTETRAGVRYAF